MTKIRHETEPLSHQNYWIIELTREGNCCIKKTAVVQEWKMAWTSKWSFEIQETNGGWCNEREKKKRKETYEDIFCASLAVFLSNPFISWSVLTALCSITRNTTAHTSTAKQFPAYISSRHHLTDRDIKILCWWWNGEWEGKKEGVQVQAWEHLIFTTMKLLLGTGRD